MRHELDIWIMGGDRRQARLAGLLAEDGHTVHTLGLGPAVEGAKEEWELSGAALADCVVLPLPMAAPGGKLNAPLAERELPLEQVFAALRPGQVICAGRVDPATEALAGDRGLVLHDYFAREELAVANAVPTALAKGHSGGVLCSCGRGRLHHLWGIHHCLLANIILLLGIYPYICDFHK